MLKEVIGRAAVTFWNRMLKCWMGKPPSSLCRRGTEMVFLSTSSCFRDTFGTSGSPANRKWSSNHFAFWCVEAKRVTSSSFILSFIYSIFIEEATVQNNLLCPPVALQSSTSVCTLPSKDGCQRFRWYQQQQWSMPVRMMVKCVIFVREMRQQVQVSSCWTTVSKVLSLATYSLPITY